MAYVIAEPCIGTKDTACVDACPVDCIHPEEGFREVRDRGIALHRSGRMHRLRRLRARLPVSAIFALDDLPEKWKEYTERNAKYFGR